MHSYKLHPELASLKKLKAILNRPLLPLINTFMKIIFRLSSDTEVSVSKYKVSSYKKENIEVAVIEPKKQTEEKMPALVFFHGGGFCLRASGAHYKIAKEYAKRLGCKVIYADYRLAPKYPFPYGIKDCYKTYKWAVENAENLNINEQKIIIGGDSAGGNLAIGVGILADMRGLIKPIAQLLIYPVTDRRMITKSMQKFIDTPMWNAKLNKKMWEMYLGDLMRQKKLKDFKDFKNLKDLKSLKRSIQLASPMEYDLSRSKKTPFSVIDFPKTYIEVAEYDCLRDEGIAFAKKLKQQGVEVKLIKIPKACHGFEVATKSSVTKKAMNQRIQFMRESLKC